MTIFEIVFVSIFSVVILFISILYSLNSKKIVNKEKKLAQEKLEKEQKEKAKLEEEKKAEEKAKKQETVKVKTNENTETIAIITANEEQPKNDSEQEVLEAKIEEKRDEKSLAEQIDELSPELKSMLFTDLLKPKF